jgi:N-acyl-D-aspartate/D-glutamate deacylase
VPPWAHEGGDAKFVERLKDQAARDRIKGELRNPAKGFENLYLSAGGGDGVLIASVLDPALAKYQGKRLSEVAKMMGKADELDALFDLVVADRNQVGAIYFMMSEDDVKLAMKQPWVSVGTDHPAFGTTGPFAKIPAHPRAFGSFPRILGKYVREQRVLTLEDAVRKMTSLAANRVRLRDRGLLKEGFFADVTVFDPATVNDVATFEDPNRNSVGIRYVLVNGQVVLADGKWSGALPGRALRGPGYTR